MKVFKHFITLLLLTSFSCSIFAASGTTGQFVAGNGTFLLNGEPFIVKAAEIHYPRIPREYWEHRIKMCKALGMNTLCLYIFWNIHEQQPGVFDFTGNNDIAAFCRLAQKNGLYVIVRPGPYVCAEWEMGGLPWWLLKQKGIQLRDNDAYFLERVKIFEQAVGEQLAPLTIQKGGPIIMVQVENEYGSYGANKPYVSAIRDIVKVSGFDEVTLFQCDWSSNFTLNALDDLIWTMNFGTGANIDAQFRQLKQLRPDSPLMCSEYWSGWFDKWGDAHETRDAEQMVNGLREMLEKNISFSLYMTHGGSTWGHWVGADSPGYSPRCSSYDYDAPINEAGQVTPKYWKLREMMAEFNGGKSLPSVPKAYPVISIDSIQLTQVAPLFDQLPDPISSYDIKPMEDFDQGYGSILYRTTLPATSSQSVLKITDAHDFAQIFIDGQRVGTLDRRHGETEVTLPVLRQNAVLDILVENMGRINYGKTINDYKGITEKVELTLYINDRAFTGDLKNWQVYCLPDSYEFAADKDYTSLSDAHMPGYYKGTFNLKKTGDTFIDLSTWSKGQVYVNGHALGRFWEIGPQQTLYMPGCWLKKGVNEIIVLDLIGPKTAQIAGRDVPILDQLNNPQPTLHFTQGDQLQLPETAPQYQGEFFKENGWQEVLFDTTFSGRYLCFEATNSYDNKLSAIAELDLLGADGKAISREKWNVVFANTEETDGGNRTADKIYDHQESTYWQSRSRARFPHTLVIDLSEPVTISGLRYLPRAEATLEGAIRQYRIFMTTSSPVQHAE